MTKCNCKACKHRDYLRDRRFDALELLGGCCEQCGEPDFTVLQVNHKVPVLRRDRGRDRHSGSALVTHILAGKVETSGLEVLCANCHQRETGEFHRRRSCKRRRR